MNCSEELISKPSKFTRYYREAKCKKSEWAWELSYPGIILNKIKYYLKYFLKPQQHPNP